MHITDNPDADALTTGAQRATAVRQIQRFHMDTRGWADIGYHFVVFQPERGRVSGLQAADDRGERFSISTRLDTSGQVFAGRSVATVPAAQLNHNTRTLAIAVFGNGDDAISVRTLYLIESLIRRHPTVKVVGGHRDVVATDCPGQVLYDRIPRIARACGLSTFRQAHR